MGSNFAHLDLTVLISIATRECVKDRPSKYSMTLQTFQGGLADIRCSNDGPSGCFMELAQGRVRVVCSSRRARNRTAALACVEQDEAALGFDFVCNQFLES